MTTDPNSNEARIAALTRQVEELNREKALMQTQFLTELEARTLALQQQQEQARTGDKPVVLPSQLKLQPLRPFAGVRGKQEETAAWLFQAEQMFRLSGVESDDLRIDFAGQALTGHASTWFFSRRKPEALNPLKTWEDFKKGLIAQFQTADSYDTAKKQLVALKQGNSTLQQYTDKFLQLNSAVGDMTEKDLAFFYRNGLRQSLQVEVLKANCQNFHDTMVLVEKLENIFVQSGSKPFSDERSTMGTDGAVPMDLGTMQHGATKPRQLPKWTQRRNEQMAKGLCFGCNKPGHLRKDCPTNPSRPPGQGNGAAPPKGGK